MTTDTELLDWLESHGDGYAVVSDDQGQWACVCEGWQRLKLEGLPFDMEASFWVKRESWRPNVREAIRAAMTDGLFNTEATP